MAFVVRTSAGILLAVRVAPRSSREGIDGVETDSAGKARLKIRVRAPPAEGAANERLVALLAKALGRPASAIRLVGGAHARNKTFEIAGDGFELTAKLQKLAGHA